MRAGVVPVRPPVGRQLIARGEAVARGVRAPPDQGSTTGVRLGVVLPEQWPCNVDRWGLEKGRAALMCAEQSQDLGAQHRLVCAGLLEEGDPLLDWEIEGLVEDGIDSTKPLA